MSIDCLLLKKFASKVKLATHKRKPGRRHISVILRDLFLREERRRTTGVVCQHEVTTNPMTNRLGRPLIHSSVSGRGRREPQPKRKDSSAGTS